VVINAFHVHSRPLWYRLRGFLRGLYALTGLPAARTDPVLFFGDYLQTRSECTPTRAASSPST